MSDVQYIKDILESHIRRGSSPDDIEILMDRILVKEASYAMEKKLEKSREKGRGGWWDNGQCSIEDLKRMLEDHLAKGDMVDVMNFAAMIFVRGELEEPAP
jgi:(2Fe-2S) ferredoxin